MITINQLQHIILTFYYFMPCLSCLGISESLAYVLNRLVLLLINILFVKMCQAGKELRFGLLWSCSATAMAHFHR